MLHINIYVHYKLYLSTYVLFLWIHLQKKQGIEYQMSHSLFDMACRQSPAYCVSFKDHIYIYDNQL